MTEFALRFPPKELRYWAAKYEINDVEIRIERDITPRVRAAGHYSPSDFLTVARWKSPRAVRHCEKNTAEFVEAVTRTALSTPNEQLRIEVLTLLQGVDWPTASVLLHFGFEEQYPIVDFRALWSLNAEPPKTGYTFEFWWSYVLYCRRIATTYGLTMRTVDRALWQYSKQYQR